MHSRHSSPIPEGRWPSLKTCSRMLRESKAGKEQMIQGARHTKVDMVCTSILEGTVGGSHRV